MGPIMRQSIDYSNLYLSFTELRKVSLEDLQWYNSEELIIFWNIKIMVRVMLPSDYSVSYSLLRKVEITSEVFSELRYFQVLYLLHNFRNILYQIMKIIKFVISFLLCNQKFADFRSRNFYFRYLLVQKFLII